jgi:hypothetical protein
MNVCRLCVIQRPLVTWIYQNLLMHPKHLGVICGVRCSLRLVRTRSKLARLQVTAAFSGTAFVSAAQLRANISTMRVTHVMIQGGSRIMAGF